MRLRSAALLAATIITLPCSALATGSPWQIIAQWDNDLLIGTDDGYTNGSRIAFARELPTDSKEHYFLENILRQVTRSTRNVATGHESRSIQNKPHFQYGIGLTQLMYTPDDPYALTPPDGERPYAGWLGLEVSLQASTNESASTATLSVGTTGDLSYAQDMQKWVHQNISNSPVYQGWDTQAPGELTLNLHLDHKTRIDFKPVADNLPIDIDGFYEWGGALGNFRTAAYLGAFMRAGYNLPSSHATPRLQLGSFTETIFEAVNDEQDKFSLYGFAGVRGYGVLHDISLNGPLFRDWDESVDLEPWVAEFSAGLGARWDRIELSFAHTIRSHEFKDQDNRSRYGSLMVRLSSQF